MSAALEVSGLTLAIGGVAVVDDVSFSVAPGEVMALVGESGCGKSITALALMRLLPRAVRLAGGRIMLGAEDIATLPERRMRALRGRGISMIFQEPQAALDPLAPIGAQIGEAACLPRAVCQTAGRILLGAEDIATLPERRMRALRGRRISMIFQEPQAALDPLAPIGAQIREASGLPRAAARAAVRRMIAEVGIADPDRRIDQYPFELSGGMSQRVMIASALIGEPSVLVADEPTTALDVTIQAQILDLLRRLAAERGTAIVLITHDMGVVADIADRVGVMYAGRIAEIGPTAAVFARPRHPYTARLLAAIPRLADAPKSRLAVIEGSVPAPAQYGAGCRFAGRCPHADARCSAEPPPLRETGGGHLAACWHSERLA